MRFRSLGPCLLALSMAACATSGAVPRPFPSPDWDTSASAPDGAPDKPGESPASVSQPQEATAENANASASTPEGDWADNPATPPSLTARRYDGRAVAEFALGFRGVPYRLGGADPAAGFDCSGLVQYVFAQYGIDVPRVVEEQYEVGAKVKPSDIKPGDLVFFSTNGNGASHVAIFVGENRFVHAPNSTGVVRVETLTSAYWGSRYVGARRVTPSTTGN
jgi:cell wall-associated NlpC family hydrolase